MSATPGPEPSLRGVVRNIITIQDAFRYLRLHMFSDRHTLVTEGHPIGQGSFGSVYRGQALISGLCTDVVIKYARCPRDSPIKPRTRVTRLLREVTAWKQLDHRNVAKFYGLDCTSSNMELIMFLSEQDADPHGQLRIPGLVSPFLKYMVLDYLERYPDRRQACVIDVARGLTYMHKKYIIHGDVRPENIRVDRNGVVKLIDFGFSRLLYCKGFTTNAIYNLSPRFAAPELILPPNHQVSRASFKSDVYSFSMCMLQMLAHQVCREQSVPFNHIQCSEAILWPYITYICQNRGRPIREGYPNTIGDVHWNIMAMAWNHDKELRPEMHSIFEALIGRRRPCTSATGPCWL